MIRTEKHNEIHLKEGLLYGSRFWDSHQPAVMVPSPEWRLGTRITEQVKWMMWKRADCQEHLRQSGVSILVLSAVCTTTRSFSLTSRQFWTLMNLIPAPTNGFLHLMQS